MWLSESVYVCGETIGLKDGVKEEEIKALFTEAGEIEKVTIARHFDTKKALGHAYISFKVSSGSKLNLGSSIELVSLVKTCVSLFPVLGYYFFAAFIY